MVREDEWKELEWKFGGWKYSVYFRGLLVHWPGAVLNAQCPRSADSGRPGHTQACTRVGVQTQGVQYPPAHTPQMKASHCKTLRIASVHQIM